MNCSRKMKESLINLISRDPVKLCHVLNYNDMGALQNEWLLDMLFRTDDVTLQAHRGAFKTTTIDFYFALHVLLRPNETILYSRKTDADVKEVMKTTQNILRSGAFQKLSMEIYGVPLVLTKDTQNEVSTNLQTSITGAR